MRGSRNGDEIMRKTVFIDDALYERVVNRVGEKNFSKIVAYALNGTIRMNAIEYLRSTQGTDPDASTTPRRPGYAV